MVKMGTLYYKLTFKPGNEDVTLRTIKNFKTAADINTVINRNLLYKDSSSSSKSLIIYDEKRGKLIHDTDIIDDGCRYFIIIRRTRRQSRMKGSSSLLSYCKHFNKYNNKRYWIR